MSAQKGKYIGIKVGEIMTSSVVHLFENQTLLSAAQTFSQLGISGAPVINEANEYLGVLSRTDFFTGDTLENIQSNNEYFKNTQISQVLKRKPLISVKEDIFVEEAADVMLTNKIHRVFVKNESEEIVGVLSSYDVMAILAGCGTMDEINKLSDFCCLCGSELKSDQKEEVKSQ